MSDYKTPRIVRPFATYDDAQSDSAERGDTLLMDLHGYWWSCPCELTLHEITGQIGTAMALLEIDRADRGESP